jgi:hypothetical protein
VTLAPTTLLLAFATAMGAPLANAAPGVDWSRPFVILPPRGNPDASKNTSSSAIWLSPSFSHVRSNTGAEFTWRRRAAFSKCWYSWAMTWTTRSRSHCTLTCGPTAPAASGTAM